MRKIKLNPQDLLTVLKFAETEEAISKATIKKAFSHKGSIKINNTYINFIQREKYLKIEMIQDAYEVCKAVIDNRESEIDVIMKVGKDEDIQKMIDVFFSTNAYIRYNEAI